MSRAGDEYELVLKPRPSQPVELEVPTDTLASLEQVAVDREMSLKALIRLYVGQGLRSDLSRIYSEQLLARTAQVLNRHLESKEEVSAILREIRAVNG